MRESAAHFHLYRVSYIYGLSDKRVELKYTYFTGTGICDGESWEVDILSSCQRSLSCAKAKLVGQVTGYMTRDVVSISRVNLALRDLV